MIPVLRLSTVPVCPCLPGWLGKGQEPSTSGITGQSREKGHEKHSGRGRAFETAQVTGCCGKSQRVWFQLGLAGAEVLEDCEHEWCIRLPGLVAEHPQRSSLKTQIQHLAVPVAESQSSRCGQGWSPLRAGGPSCACHLPSPSPDAPPVPVCVPPPAPFSL